MTDSIFLGRGRSARVYRVPGEAGGVARKVFAGSSAANLFHVLFYGAPNDYTWCEAAVRAAMYRRRVLSRVVPLWFDGRLAVSTATATGHDASAKARYLDTAFVDGHRARLYSPFLYGFKTEVFDLRKHILPRLQKHLVKAGFAGTVWQAGKGQPCALANFLCVHHDTDPRKHRWVWIDLESGVPAIACYRPLDLFGYYVPQAVRFGRVLFDDLDAPRFRGWLAREAAKLQAHLGREVWDEFLRDAEALLAAHEEWARERRVSRSVKYHAFVGNISEIEAAHYLHHPARWSLRLAGIVARVFLPRLAAKLRREWAVVRPYLNPVRWARFAFKLVFLRSYRVDLSRRFALHGLKHWEDASRLQPEQAVQLRKELEDEEVSAYLADFGVHLACKPLGYVLRLSVIPYLWHQGILSGQAAALLLIFCGTVIRVSYAAFRCVENVLRLRPPPITALLVAPLPTVGTLAFPCQMLHSARQGHALSQFLIYEAFSALASKIPIWGGRDSEWDHFFNRLAHGLILLTIRPSAAAQPAARDES